MIQEQFLNLSLQLNIEKGLTNQLKNEAIIKKCVTEDGWRNAGI